MRSFDPRKVASRGPVRAKPRERRSAGQALAALYAYTYEVEHSEVRRAAELRAEAMDVSDRWVAGGCDPQDPLLAEERALLVRSFAALPAGVHRPETVSGSAPAA